MNTPIQVAERYFKLSNEANLKEVSEMLSEDSTYESVKMGLCHGADEILEKMTAFFSNYSELKWTVNSIKEGQIGEVIVDFSFKGMMKDGLEITNEGIEYFSIEGNKIRSIKVETKK